jgi:hypothetical protein
MPDRTDISLVSMSAPPAQGRGLGAIAGDFQFLEDRGEDAVGVLQDVVVPESDHAPAMGLDDRGAGFIGRVFSMLTTVQFDGQADRTAGKIDNEIANRKLPGELDAVQLTGAQVMPKRTDISSILVIGAGPIIIGQACEFDYSGTQAIKALKEEGYRIILVNSNPATIMTDPDMADATYVEPITPEIVAKIIEKERPDALLPTMGGQTALNTALACSTTARWRSTACR